QAANGRKFKKILVSDSLSENSGFRGIEVLVRGINNSEVKEINILNNRVINNLGGAHSINIQPGGLGLDGLNYGNQISDVRIEGNYIDTAAPVTGITHVLGAGGVIERSEITNNYFTHSGGGSSRAFSFNMNNGEISSLLISNNTIEKSRGHA